MALTILEIGPGIYPLDFVGIKLKEILSKNIAVHYIALDIVKENTVALNTFPIIQARVRDHVMPGAQLTIWPVHGDARTLCLRNSSVDAVVLTNVLSVPKREYCGRCGKYKKNDKGTCVSCENDFMPPLSDEDKSVIMTESLRVLRTGGIIQIHNSFTPHFAHKVIARLFERAQYDNIHVEKYGAELRVEKLTDCDQ